MKIQPANRFIEGKVTQYGEVIMVLGVRKAESATRMQLMNTYQIKSHLLRRHTSLRGAYVYAPIADFSTDDVWMYLLQVPSPWGGNNDNGASHVVGRKMVLWGITPHGLAFAWDLDEAMEERASFELGKTHPAYVEHCVSVQRLRLQAQACGWQQWTPGRLLMGQKLEKVPDGQAIDPNGAHVAVEFEKEIKTPKRYQAILGTYLVALRAGRWQRVEYVCPSADMAARLKRSFYALTEVVYKGQKAQVVHERHLDNRVTFSGIEDWPISRAV